MLDPEEKELFIVLPEYSMSKFSMFSWTIHAKTERFLAKAIRSDHQLINNMHFLALKFWSLYVVHFL